VTPSDPAGLLALPAADVGEVGTGCDLVSLLDDAWTHAGTAPRDGDVLVVTSKVVSKAEGRVVGGDKDAAVAAETDREVARRGSTRIVRTRHGFVMAAAGVDASNVEAGSLVLLPHDPDASARRLRTGFEARGRCVGIVVSDTSGRAWRTGQTDLALGAAGIVVLDDHQGRLDSFGNVLAVTAPAVADEMASAAELATGKLSRSPACLLRGLDRFVLPTGEHGAGAAALVRAESEDMFGLGAREAVTAALTAGSAGRARGFGAPASPEEVLMSVRTVLPGLRAGLTDDGRLAVRLPDDDLGAGRADATLRAVLAAHGWTGGASTDRAVLATPGL
jgi:coenzyme F420-0:L-glutamate ligase / coenzyme F420-1:gamma-L-glutamate ligase